LLMGLQRTSRHLVGGYLKRQACMVLTK
jgi:hypothetical protein